MLGCWALATIKDLVWDFHWIEDLGCHKLYWSLFGLHICDVLLLTEGFLPPLRGLSCIRTFSDTEAMVWIGSST